MVASAEKSVQLDLIGVRLGYASVFEARAVKDVKDSKKSYRAEFVLDPTDPQLATAKAEIKRIAAERWGDDLAGIQWPVVTGDSVAAKALKSADAAHAAFDGTIIIKSKNNEGSLVPLKVAAPNGRDITTMDTGPEARTMLGRHFYPGVTVHATINFVTWVNAKKERGVTGWLQMICSTGKGDKFEGMSSGGLDAASRYGAHMQAHVGTVVALRPDNSDMP